MGMVNISWKVSIGDVHCFVLSVGPVESILNKGNCVIVLFLPHELFYFIISPSIIFFPI